MDAAPGEQEFKQVVEAAEHEFKQVVSPDGAEQESKQVVQVPETEALPAEQEFKEVVKALCLFASGTGKSEVSSSGNALSEALANGTV